MNDHRPPFYRAAERLRTIFLSEQTNPSLTAQFSDSDLATARAATESLDTWSAFLHAHDPAHHSLASRLRPHLSVLALNDAICAASSSPPDIDDPRYELDPGPPLGPLPDTRVYRLLGQDPTPTPASTSTSSASSTPATRLTAATIGILSAHRIDTPTADSDLIWPDPTLRRLSPPCPCPPRPPVFPEAPSSSTPTACLLTVLESSSPDTSVARNAVMMHNLRVLRERALTAISNTTDRPTPTTKASSTPSVPPPSSTDDTTTQPPKFKAEPQLVDARNTTTSRPRRTRPPASDDDVLHIPNAVPPLVRVPTDNRPRAQVHAATALVLAHSGFTHSSTTALDILADVTTHFIERIGRSLSECRDVGNDVDLARRDEHGIPKRSQDQFLEEIRRICTSGFRGGFQDLVAHACVDVPRMDQMLREADRKIREQVHYHLQRAVAAGVKSTNATEAKQHGAPPVKVKAEAESKSAGNKKDGITSEGSDEREAGVDVKPVVTEDDVRLDADAFAFGYLNRSVRLDVLDNIRVPHQLAYGDDITPSTAVTGSAKMKGGKLVKRKDGTARGIADSTSIKTEATTMDVGD